MWVWFLIPFSCVSYVLCFSSALGKCFQGPGKLSWKMGQVFTAMLSRAGEKPNCTSLGRAVELLGRATVFGAEWAEPSLNKKHGLNGLNKQSLGKKKKIAQDGGSEMVSLLVCPRSSWSSVTQPQPGIILGLLCAHSPSVLCL